jgi:hypothetical protein
MKKMTLCLLLISMALIGLAQPITASNTDLQLKIDQLENDLALHKREVAIQIQESQSTNTWNTFGHVAAIVLAIFSGPIAVAIRTRSDKKRLVELATEKAREEMDISFPPMAKKLMEDYLSMEVPIRVSALLAISDEKRADEALCTGTSILVIAEDELLAEERAAFLRKRGFLDIRTSLPKPIPELPPHQVCFIEHPGPEDVYHALGNKYIQALIEHVGEHKKTGMFFYVPFQYAGLDYSLLAQKNFANGEAQIAENLKRLLRQMKSIQVI